MLVAVVAATISLLVTATQLPALWEISQHTVRSWHLLALGTLALPILLGVVVGAAMLRARRPHTSGPRRPRRLEQVCWLVAEGYLVLFPLVTALLPLALAPRTPPAVLTTCYTVLAMYAMVATLLGSIVMSGVRRWIYALLIQVVGTLAFVSSATDPVTVGLYTFFSIALCTAMMAASQILQHFAQSVDEAYSADEKRAAEATVIAARVREAARIDGLVHDHILSALLLASHTDGDAPATAEHDPAHAVRVQAGRALDILDELGRPSRTPDVEPLSTLAMRQLLESQLHTLDPTISVLTTGTRTAPVPGRVAHTIIAAAMESLRNSLRHSGSTSGDGGAVTRRVTLHVSATGVTTTVQDDGAGFDTTAVPTRRMGVRGSILRRMSDLPGGAAQIDSAIGEGTRVSLSWIDPAGSASHRAGAPRPSSVGRGPSTTVDGSHSGLPRVLSRRSIPLVVGTGVVVFLCLLGMAALSLPAFHPTWATWVSLALVAVVGLFALVRLTRRSTHRGRATAWLLAVVTPVITALGVWAGRFAFGQGVEIWQIAAATMLLVTLAAAGRDGPALFGTLSTTAVLVVGALARPESALALHARWITVVTFVFAAHEVALWLAAQLTRAEALRAAQARRHVRENESLELLSARRERSEELDDMVRPLLTTLAGGARLTPQLRTNAALVEAQLRNGLRARCFVGTSVATATAEAFRRGVVVELMDDGALADVLDSLRARVEAAVTHRIESARDGVVTVRVLPPGRDVLVTIVHRSDTEQMERAEIDAAGVLQVAGRPREVTR